MTGKLDKHRQKIAALDKQLKKAQKQLSVLKHKKDEEGMQAKMKECTEEVRKTNAQIKEMRKNAPPTPEYAMGVQDGGEPFDIRVHLRGDVQTWGLP